MKVLGSNGASVIVELTGSEWQAIGGQTYTSGYTRHADPTRVPDIMELVDTLRAIKNASPDLQRIRSAFQAFLLLTEGDAIAEALKKCGVAEPVVEDDEPDEPDEQE